MKSNTNGLLTDSSCSGRFGHVFSFMLRPLLWLSFLFLKVIVVQAEPDTAQSGFEFGRPMFRYFTMRDYGASDQNWVAIQDRRGRMLFGNRDCVLEYDGYVWKTIPIAGGVFIRALAMDQTGAIWVGGVNCLGQLMFKGNSYVFNSMEHLVPDSSKPFGDCWDAVTNGDKVYFSTNKALLLLRNGAITPIPWPSDTGFSWLLFACSNRVFIHARGQPLYEVVDDHLVSLIDAKALNSTFYEENGLPELTVLGLGI
jgi:hypothetical protein